MGSMQPCGADINRFLTGRIVKTHFFTETLSNVRSVWCPDEFSDEPQMVKYNVQC